MKTLAMLPLAALLQWTSTVSCDGCGPGGPAAPEPPRPYDSCSTSADCPSSTPDCTTLGTPTGLCSKSCATDSDCPGFGPADHSEICVRLGNHPAFCANPTGFHCPDYRQTPTSRFARAATPTVPSRGLYICVPKDIACGDGECVGAEEVDYGGGVIDRCAADCFYDNCDTSNPFTCGRVEGERALYCVGLQRPPADGGTEPATSDGGRLLEGLCTVPETDQGPPTSGCQTDSDCRARNSFPGVCLSGFSKFPICVQSCSAAGADSDCRNDQRCVSAGAGFVCAPPASNL